MTNELTIENLQEAGLNLSEATKLYNTIDADTFQCNEGNFFVSKTENKFYTGIDFYRKICFLNGELKRPYGCPDLFPEYFNLALDEFLEKQREVLSVLFNEKDQFNEFILHEIEEVIFYIDGLKAYVEKMNRYENKSKKKSIAICESYIQFLKGKNFTISKPEKTLFDFIHNVKDKETFVIDLKNTFENESGISFKIMIELLKAERILLIGDRNFAGFYRVIKPFFNSDIGSQNGLNDLYKHTDDEQTIHSKKIEVINEKLKPLITKHKL